MPELLVRLIWAALIVAAGVIVYWLVSQSVLGRVQAKRLGLENIRPGVVAILYFTTPGCVPCKTIQRPALQHLQELLAERIQVIEVDAQAQPDLADYWGVLSVPTTFLIDAQGHPRRVNHGVVRTERLLEQLGEITDGELTQVVHNENRHPSIGEISL